MTAQKDIRTFRKSLLRWFSRHGRDLPWRHTRDPYAILVSEVMLQQTQVAAVVPYYNEWLRRFPNFAALAEASEFEVLHAWQGLGYYTRARNLLAAAMALQDGHAGRFPRDVKAIRQLPGIGPYTANAVATFAFDQPVPAVEANVGRLVARLFNIRIPIDTSAGRDLLWKRAGQLTPARHAGRFNSALMDLGATVCLARKPKCALCPVRSFCRARNPGSLPVKKPRPRTVHLSESHAFIVRRNEILLERCTNRWRGMWMLPVLRGTPLSFRPIHQAAFPFTHHRVTLHVFQRRAPRLVSSNERWFGRHELGVLPIPSPHRRALKTLLS